MSRAHASKCSGTTLLEVALATFLLVLFTGAALMMANRTGLAYRTDATGAELDELGMRALDEIATALRSTDPETHFQAVASPPQSETALDFDRAIGLDEVNGTVLTGPPERYELQPDPGDPADGVDNDGDGLVDEGRLVWIENEGQADERRVVVCNGVTELLEDELAGNGLDDNANGLTDEAGFCVEFYRPDPAEPPTRATVRMTLARLDPHRHVITHTFERTIALRN